MEPRIQYAKTSDGVSIAYCVMGEGSALVFTSNVWGDIHWYTADPGARGVVDAFVDSGCRVVRYDGRGMGASERDVSDFCLAARLRDLEAVVASADVTRFAVCGYAEGGPPAIAYAVANPERVSHLLLVNTFASVAAYYDTVPLMRAVAGMRQMAGDQWEFFTQTIASAVTGFGDSEAAKRTAALFRAGMSAEAFFAYRDAGYAIDVSELLPLVRVPTMIMYDRSGEYAGKRLLQVLATGIPNARFVATDDYASVGLEFLGMKPASRKQPIARPSEAGTAVILFADIANSTALTERMGDAAFREKARELDGAMRAVIRECAGTTVEGKLLGDGVLAVFTSAREAIEAALACGRAGSHGGLPLHLGIHAGDVIREGNNVFGGAVNIASRISGLSAPGEVLVSETVRSLARTSAGVSFEDRGEQSLKGVLEPQRLFAIKTT